MGQKPKQIIKRYSLAFKQQVLKEYEAGRSASESLKAAGAVTLEERECEFAATNGRAA